MIVEISIEIFLICWAFVWSNKICKLKMKG